MRFAFGECTVDLDRYQLARDGVPVHLEPQVFDVLVYLLLHRDRVVPKAELMEQVWGGQYISQSAVASRIMAARRAVADDGHAQRVIRTSFGRGYQFVAEVRREQQAGVTAPSGVEASGVEASGVGMASGTVTSGTGTTVAATTGVETVGAETGGAGAEGARAEGSATVGDGALPPFVQDIKFCRAFDGTRIAYAVAGRGPALVKAANWMTHVDYDAESRVWRHWLTGLSRNFTLVRYDERGCGMSDWDVDRIDFQAWVEDLLTVVDELGLQRFPLLGVSQGAAVAVAFAARHPERVSSLVLYGSYARGRLRRADGPEARRAAALDIELARVGWGRDDSSFRQVFTAQFLPDGSRDEWAEFDDLQRRTISAENAVAFLETFAQIDVTAEAGRVRCPTLVLHARDDLRVPIAAGRELAALIPGSRFVPLPGRNHLLTRAEPAWPTFLAELERFLGV